MEETKCPVCGWEIEDEGKKAIVEGQVVVVCSDECVTELAKKEQAPGHGTGPASAE